MRLKRKPGRPGGRRYGNSVRVRLPVEFEDLLPLACRLTGTSLSGLVRAGLDVLMGQMVTAAVGIVRDPKTPAFQKLRLMRFLRECRKAALVRQGPKPLVEALRRAEAKVPSFKVPIAQKDKRMTGFSTERLFRFLNALGRDIRIVVTERPRSRKRSRLTVATSR